MTFTFNPSLSTPLSRVRQHIGDTTEAGAQVEDATINAYLGQGMTELAAAARLCWDLSARYAGRPDIDVDNQLQRFSQVSKQYAALAMKLDTQAAAEGPETVATDSTPGIIRVGSDVSNSRYLYGLPCYPPSIS